MALRHITHMDATSSIADSDPTVNDDTTKGYVAGRSSWHNTASGALFECRSHAVGAAVWRSKITRLHEVTGAPDNGVGLDGEFAFRSDGGVGTRIYFKVAGVWAGIL